MSSHREAPEISKDPAADNTDVYAFVTPGATDTVTLIANFIPFQLPYGGPNFNEFADDVLYEIKICNKGDAVADVTYQFRFTTQIRNRNTFLYNTGPITSIGSANWNRPQFYTVTRVVRGGASTVLGSDLAVPPCNVGTRSTPNYAATFTNAAVHQLGGGRQVFAGQRADPFFVDLGSIFDLAGLRPFNTAHLIPLPSAAGVNSLRGLNVHTIAIQVPKTDLTRGGINPTSVGAATSVIGVYASASRYSSRILDASTGKTVGSGPFRQVSRLANPLFNEVINPMAQKDLWNTLAPATDSRFAQYVTRPELGGLLPVLYPGVFPNLAAYDQPRADLAAILLTGIPAGVVPNSGGFQNFTGTTQADLLRLNLAVAPAANPNSIGLIAGDTAGFPNGRRLADNVVAIELRAIAGATIPLVDPTYTPDAAAAQLTDGTTNNNQPLLTAFPYVGTPNGGYRSTPGVGVAS
jgi:Domain of unknown function (DUF4331)